MQLWIESASKLQRVHFKELKNRLHCFVGCTLKPLPTPSMSAKSKMLLPQENHDRNPSTQTLITHRIYLPYLHLQMQGAAVAQPSLPQLLTSAMRRVPRRLQWLTIVRMFPETLFLRRRPAAPGAARPSARLTTAVETVWRHPKVKACAVAAAASSMRRVTSGERRAYVSTRKRQR